MQKLVLPVSEILNFFNMVVIFKNSLKKSHLKTTYCNLSERSGLINRYNQISSILFLNLKKVMRNKDIFYIYWRKHVRKIGVI